MLSAIASILAVSITPYFGTCHIFVPLDCCNFKRICHYVQIPVAYLKIAIGHKSLQCLLPRFDIVDFNVRARLIRIIIFLCFAINTAEVLDIIFSKCWLCFSLATLSAVTVLFLGRAFSGIV
jgi:hypothetical protein